jgi:hypothetical protein
MVVELVGAGFEATGSAELCENSLMGVVLEHYDACLLLMCPMGPERYLGRNRRVQKPKSQSRV